MTSLEIRGSVEFVLSFFIISNASREDFPQTPQEELVKKSLLIFEILIF